MNRMGVGMLVGATLAMGGASVIATAPAEAYAVKPLPPIKQKLGCKITGSHTSAGTRWVFYRCGNKMTVVREGMKGYCTETYKVGTPYRKGAMCGYNGPM